MNIFQSLLNLFSPKVSSTTRHFPIYVLNQRCNEPLAGQVDTMNELSLTEDGDHAYFVRKVLHTSGRSRCFGQVEVQLWFDRNRQLMRHEEFGGRWLSEDEYQEALARFNAPTESAEEENSAPESEPANDSRTVEQ